MDRISPTPEGAKLVIGRIRNIADDVWTDPDSTAARVWQVLNPLVRGCKNIVADADYLNIEGVPVSADLMTIIGSLSQEERQIREIADQEEDDERAQHLMAIAQSINEAVNEILIARNARFGEEIVPDYI
ncbi:MAG: hypothetical protein G01um101425_689 [Candidatus Peregrinibacteria bacterium Gr01-1014_25]|nr:MAG: hypothetical protein G01um101425_689 [Candidatus Peregrinibacteria bacterium Gr01-1014_25]